MRVINKSKVETLRSDGLHVTDEDVQWLCDHPEAALWVIIDDDGIRTGEIERSNGKLTTTTIQHDTADDDIEDNNMNRDPSIYRRFTRSYRFYYETDHGTFVGRIIKVESITDDDT